MNTTTLEELKKTFIADHDKSIAKIKQAIAQERKTERQQEIMRELAQSASGLEAVQQMRGIMARLSAFGGYQDGEAEERRKDFSVVVCRPYVDQAEQKQKHLYVVAGGCDRGREKSAIRRRKQFSLWVNYRSAEEIEAVNDLIRWGIL